jgi:hypothetical protein
MAFTRPSGILIVDSEQAPVFQEVTQVDPRGRINLLPRWIKRLGWLSVEPVETQALMVFEQPGRISLRNWETDGKNVAQRYLELMSHDDDASREALRLIQDRYQKLIIPAKKSCSLGAASVSSSGTSSDTSRRTTDIRGGLPDQDRPAVAKLPGAAVACATSIPR